jgi:hypothetical protein
MLVIRQETTLTILKTTLPMWMCLKIGYPEIYYRASSLSVLERDSWLYTLFISIYLCSNTQNLTLLVSIA